MTVSRYWVFTEKDEDGCQVVHDIDLDAVTFVRDVRHNAASSRWMSVGGRGISDSLSGEAADSFLAALRAWREAQDDTQ